MNPSRLLTRFCSAGNSNVIPLQDAGQATDGARRFGQFIRCDRVAGDFQVLIETLRQAIAGRH